MKIKRIFSIDQSEYPISISDYEKVLDVGFKDVELVPIHEREYFKDYETLYSFLSKVPILDTFYNFSDKIIDSVK